MARIDLAAVLILVVLLLAALGSCFPQFSPGANSEQLAHWEAAVRARYGRLAGLMVASGAFRCFRSPVFLVPLGLLTLAALVCTLDRWRAVWQRALRRPVRCSNIAFESAPHAAKLTAPDADLVGIVRESLRQRSFRVRSETSGGIVYVRGDHNRLAPLATLVTHLAVLLLLMGAVLSAVHGWREEVSVPPGETAEVGHGTRLALRNEGFAIVRHPDGSAAGYRAEIAVLEGNQQVARGSVRVNQPLSYRGVRFVLHSYEGTEERYGITLLAVHDKGYDLVIVAGFLLLFGLTVSFNFPHCWIHARIEPGGVLRLAGRADKRAWGFGREFEMLAREVERAAGK